MSGIHYGLAMHSLLRPMPRALLPPVTCLTWPCGQLPSSTNTVALYASLPGAGSLFSMVCWQPASARLRTAADKTLFIISNPNKSCELIRAPSLDHGIPHLRYAATVEYLLFTCPKLCHCLLSVLSLPSCNDLQPIILQWPLQRRRF